MKLNSTQIPINNRPWPQLQKRVQLLEAGDQPKREDLLVPLTIAGAILGGVEGALGKTGVGIDTALVGGVGAVTGLAVGSVLDSLGSPSGLSASVRGTVIGGAAGAGLGLVHASLSRILGQALGGCLVAHVAAGAVLGAVEGCLLNHTKKIT